MKRDPKVELMRIIACAIVIGTHTYLPSIVNGSPDASRVFIACLLADGVAVFWLINGFFLFRDKSYARLIQHTARHILFPMLLISTFAFYFGDWLTKGETLQQSFAHTPEEYTALLRGVLSWSNAVPNMGHLWYLYVYVLLMLLFPVLRSFVDYLNGDSNREKVFLGVSAALMLFNDISGNKFGTFSHHTINACFPAAIEILWGHILYKYRERLKKYFIAIGFGGFVVLNLLRMFIQIHNYQIDSSNTVILYWYTLMGLLCAVCIAIFCLSTGMKKEEKTKTNVMICFLASHTMNIYLFHIFVRNFIYRYGFQEILWHDVFNGRQKFFFEISYSAVMIVAIFVISLAISISVRTTITVCQNIFLTSKETLSKM